MTKIISIKLGTGNLKDGFSSVNIELRNENNQPTINFPPIQLSCCQDLATLIDSWSSLYCDYYYRYRGNDFLDMRLRLTVRDAGIGITNYSEQNFADISQRLKKTINNWLNDSFDQIEREIRDRITKEETVYVIFSCQDGILQLLPWHLWDFFENFKQAEMAISSEFTENKSPSRSPKTKVRILAILGGDNNIDIEKDRQELERLPDADVQFLVKPSIKELNNYLHDVNGWDILCFSGHSQTINNQGYFSINDNETLLIETFFFGLEKAIERGLHLAIFNSCDGLGLAQNLAKLHIPDIIVMREPVPDFIAQEFFKYFLQSYSQGNDLYIAEREARQRLQTFESDYIGASWLPVIYQNSTYIPLTWQQLKGENPYYQEFKKTFEKNLRDNAFFEQQKNIDISEDKKSILSICQANWPFILQGLYVDRTQQNDALEKVKEMGKIKNITLFLIEGEPGAGKSALMKWLAYQLNNENEGIILEYPNEGIILNSKDSEDLNRILNEIPKYCQNQNINQHFYLIVDDFFRQETLTDKIIPSWINAPFRLTIIATTKSNEYNLSILKKLKLGTGNVKQFELKLSRTLNPNEDEVERIYEKICATDKKAKERLKKLSSNEVEKLKQAPTMLVLMLQLSQGQPFDEIIHNVIQDLPHEDDAPVRNIFGVICSFYQYGLRTSEEIIKNCLGEIKNPKDIEAYLTEDQLYQEGSLKGLVKKEKIERTEKKYSLVVKEGKKYIEKTEKKSVKTEGFTAIHEEIAKQVIISEYKDEKRKRNFKFYDDNTVKRWLTNSIEKLCKNNSEHHSWLVSLLKRLIISKQEDLVKDILNTFNQKIKDFQDNSSISRLITWENIYDELKLTEEQERIGEAILKATPQEDYDMALILNFIKKEKGFIDDTKLAEAVEWVKKYPEEYFTIGILIPMIQKCNNSLKQEMINFVNELLKSLLESQENKQEFQYIIPYYLGLVMQLNNDKKQQDQNIKNAKENTKKWLDKYPDSNHVLVNYIDLIKKYGSPSEKLAVIETTDQQNILDNNVNVIDKILDLEKSLLEDRTIERDRLQTQIIKSIEKVESYLEEHPKEQNPRTAYISFIGRIISNSNYKEFTETHQFVTKLNQQLEWIRTTDNIISQNLWDCVRKVILDHKFIDLETLRNFIREVLKKQRNNLKIHTDIFRYPYFRDHIDFDTCVYLAQYIIRNDSDCYKQLKEWQNKVYAGAILVENNLVDNAKEYYIKIIESVQNQIITLQQYNDPTREEKLNNLSQTLRLANIYYAYSFLHKVVNSLIPKNDDYNFEELNREEIVKELKNGKSKLDELLQQEQYKNHPLFNSNVSQYYQIVAKLLLKKYQTDNLKLIEQKNKFRNCYKKVIHFYKIAIEKDDKKNGYFWNKLGLFYRYEIETNQPYKIKNQPHTSKKCFENAFEQIKECPKDNLSISGVYITCVELAELEIESGNKKKAKEIINYALDFTPLKRKDIEQKEKLQERIRAIEKL